MKRVLVAVIAAATLIIGLPACNSGSPSPESSPPSSSHLSSPAPSGTGARNRQPATITCSPDGSVNACPNAYETSAPGGTVISILNAAEPETGSDIGSETFTLTVQPARNFKVLGVKTGGTANGGSVNDLNPNDLSGESDFITVDPATNTMTIRDVLDIVGINTQGGIVYKTRTSAG